MLLAVLLVGCGDRTGATDPTDPGERPSAVPPADGPVQTRAPVTVMDTGRPELCLGAVAESYPPQCGGPPLVGWSWADHPGAFEETQGVRWGEFHLVGTFDGETFTVTAATPAARYDGTPPPDDSGDTDPTARRSAAELQRIQRGLGELPGMLGSEVARGAVHVYVVHDDGSLQRWADAAYGEGTVRVDSALVPT